MLKIVMCVISINLIACELNVNVDKTRKQHRNEKKINSSKKLIGVVDDNFVVNMSNVSSFSKRVSAFVSKSHNTENFELYNHFPKSSVMTVNDDGFQGKTTWTKLSHTPEVIKKPTGGRGIGKTSLSKANHIANFSLRAFGRFRRNSLRKFRHVYSGLLPESRSEAKVITMRFYEPHKPGELLKEKNQEKAILKIFFRSPPSVRNTSSINIEINSLSPVFSELSSNKKDKQRFGTVKQLITKLRTMQIPTDRLKQIYERELLEYERLGRRLRSTVEQIMTLKTLLKRKQISSDVLKRQEIELWLTHSLRTARVIKNERYIKSQKLNMLMKLIPIDEEVQAKDLENVSAKKQHQNTLRNHRMRYKQQHFQTLLKELVHIRKEGEKTDAKVEQLLNVARKAKKKWKQTRPNYKTLLTPTTSAKKEQEIRKLKQLLHRKQVRLEALEDSGKDYGNKLRQMKIHARRKYGRKKHPSLLGKSKERYPVKLRPLNKMSKPKKHGRKPGVRRGKQNLEKKYMHNKPAKPKYKLRGRKGKAKHKGLTLKKQHKIKKLPAKSKTKHREGKPDLKGEMKNIQKQHMPRKPAKQHGRKQATVEKKPEKKKALAHRVDEQQKGKHGAKPMGKNQSKQQTRKKPIKPPSKLQGKPEAHQFKKKPKHGTTVANKGKKVENVEDNGKSQTLKNKRPRIKPKSKVGKNESADEQLWRIGAIPKPPCDTVCITSLLFTVAKRLLIRSWVIVRHIGQVLPIDAHGLLKAMEVHRYAINNGFDDPSTDPRTAATTVAHAILDISRNLNRAANMLAKVTSEKVSHLRLEDTFVTPGTASIGEGVNAKGGDNQLNVDTINDVLVHATKTLVRRFFLLARRLIHVAGGHNFEYGSFELSVEFRRLIGMLVDVDRNRASNYQAAAVVAQVVVRLAPIMRQVSENLAYFARSGKYLMDSRSSVVAETAETSSTSISANQTKGSQSVSTEQSVMSHEMPVVSLDDINRRIMTVLQSFDKWSQLLYAQVVKNGVAQSSVTDEQLSGNGSNEAAWGVAQMILKIAQRMRLIAHSTENDIERRFSLRMDVTSTTLSLPIEVFSLLSVNSFITIS
jgi:hypothetical protein